MADFGKLNFSVAFNPTSAFPIDARTMFESYDDALAAAKSAKEAGSTDSVYYYGMVLTVVDPTNKTAKHYIIEAGEETEAGEKEGKLTEIIKISDVVDNLTTADSTKPLSANQGKEIAEHINEVVDEAGQAINLKVDKTDIADNLETEDESKVLSAKQGVVLKNTIQQAANMAAEKISEAVTSANKYTDEKLAGINIDDSNYAKLNATNTFSLYQTFAGSMPTTTEYNTTVVGQNVRVIGSTDKDYGMLLGETLVDAGFIKAYSPYWGCKIELNATSVDPAIVVSSMYGNDRTFTFPYEGGALATEGTVDKKLANLKTGGSKIYRHRFTYNSSVYEMLSLSPHDMTSLDFVDDNYTVAFQTHLGNILSLANITSSSNLYAGATVFSLQFLAIEFNTNTGMTTAWSCSIGEISNYTITEV